MRVKALKAGTNPGLVGTAKSKAGAVPETATWAMMLAGYGPLGSAMQARRAKVAFA